MSEPTLTTPQAVPPVLTSTSPAAGPPGGGARAEAGLARSAGILGFGNVASRVLGLLRDTIISAYFGSSGQLSAYRLAARVPTMVYDLLVGGMLSAALVPVFSDYARPERRDELARVVSAVTSLIAVVMGVVVLLIELFADPFATVLSSFEDPALHGVVAQSLRVVAPAVLLFGLAGALTGLLYALKRFTYTALSASVFNLGIVIAAPLLARRLGVYALPLGIVTGSLLQVIVLMPGVRDIQLRLSLAWEHPAVQRILQLYVPIALGLIISEIQQIVDGRWASSTGSQSVAWMGYATVLIQMPLGLVPVAVSLAALPSLSQRAAAGDWDTFRSIFARGLRLVLVLMIPAAVGLWALADPLIRLLFQHGAFTANDTMMTATALRLYLLGLLFAGVDFLLNYTFYARQDTRTPAIVGVIAIGAYFVAALSLMPRFGFLGLVLADSVKQATHAALMTILLFRGVGRLQGHNVINTTLKAGAVGLVMGVGVWWLAGVMTASLPQGLIGRLVVVAAAAGVGGGFYIGALRLLGVAEVVQLVGAVTNRLRPARA
jgi:putative peptidoglycan lipid II flippase